ncbi:hypothetical protein ENSA5_04430 [Enhygromyxa salina]|uniref:DUF839 domain-containing protein n=2 Tax=Enhygromyxa salina TaxID=215803 RepID=A0A2S9YIW6_9BACT|nr:hypothetical protein ENSA5_04430 [Enhygromyxa salina]
MITGGATTIALSLATLGRSRRASARGRWGELIADPEGVLDLPAGFSYEVLEAVGDDMDDGYRVPGRPDGMACFAGPDDTLILMRNHENSAGDLANGPYKTGQRPPVEAYEDNATGGVTRVVIDANTYARISSNLVLVGTVRNCAGGPSSPWCNASCRLAPEFSPRARSQNAAVPGVLQVLATKPSAKRPSEAARGIAPRAASPWGWLSCEENTNINDGVRHGYTFLCPTDAATVQTPQRIDGYGRYNHEAVCVDPSNNYAYLTEDRGDSCLYRFVPDEVNEPFVGTLQALKVVGVDEYDTFGMAEDEVLDVEWVDIDNPDPDDDSVRDEAQAKGAARIVRGEGIWFFEGQVYICSTSGGPIGKGQIFRLIDGDSPTLELLVHATDQGVLDNPDNITVAPWGEVFIAEDGDGDQYIRWVNELGEICDFARNAISDSELAGVCFSPDGQAMFVNIQNDGLTLVVTGPFPMMGGGHGDGDGDTGDSETGDGDPGDGDPGDGDPGEAGDELGDGGDTGTGTGGDSDAGIEDAAGCSCSVEGDDPSGLAAAVTVAAAIVLRGLLVRGDEGDSVGD